MNIAKIQVQSADNGFIVKFLEFNEAIHYDEGDEELMVFQDRKEFRNWLGDRVDEWSDKFKLIKKGDL